jgi:hypothetical protein
MPGRPDIVRDARSSESLRSQAKYVLPGSRGFLLVGWESSRKLKNMLQNSLNPYNTEVRMEARR